MKVKKPSKVKVSEHPIFPIQINVHNLMMVPEDVPEENHFVFNEKGEKVYYSSGEWYCHSDYYDEQECLCSTPRLWYEIPEFDLKLTREDLIIMSKEDLIKMILKRI